jgi:ribonuclease BN (tRNA processing enzyme)
MKALFLGVGESCDEYLPNTSILIRTHADKEARSVLLDCGFTAAHQYWRYTKSPEELDALWVSHFHGDHFFGVPALLLRFWEMKRRKLLTVLGQTGIEDIVRKTMDLAYPNFMKKLTYSVEFIEMEPEKTVNAAGLTWRCAENAHSKRDMALRIDDGKKSLFYSGDGQPTPATLALAQGCDLVIHEAFFVDEPDLGHNSVKGSIDFALRAKTPNLALVHMQRDIRRERYQEIIRMLADICDLHAILPEPGDLIEL